MFLSLLFFGFLEVHFGPRLYCTLSTEPMAFSSSSSKFSRTKVVTVVMIPIKRLAHASVTKAELKGVAKYITRRRNDEFSRKKDEENRLFFEREKILEVTTKKLEKNHFVSKLSAKQCTIILRKKTRQNL